MAFGKGSNATARRIMGRSKRVISLTTSAAPSSSFSALCGVTMDACNHCSPALDPVQKPMRGRTTRARVNGGTDDDQLLGTTLDALPHDLLVRLICKVEHTDLKQLLLVSKFVSAATLVAREQHFAFATPLSKAMCRFKATGGAMEEMYMAEEAAPNAPMQHRVARSPLSPHKLASIAITLF